MTNKKLGNNFESVLCEILSNHGFWAHNMAQNQAGQPADVIAVRGGKASLIDCKVCSNDRFVLPRMEDNQDLSMELWSDCGNGHGWFAMLLSDEEIYMVDHLIIREKAKTCSSLNRKEIRELGIPLPAWLGFR